MLKQMSRKVVCSGFVLGSLFSIQAWSQDIAAASSSIALTEYASYNQLVAAQLDLIEANNAQGSKTSSDLESFGGLFPGSESALIASLPWTDAEDSEYMGGCPTSMGNPTQQNPYVEISYKSFNSTLSMATPALGSMTCVSARYARYWNEIDTLGNVVCMASLALPSACW